MDGAAYTKQQEGFTPVAKEDPPGSGRYEYGYGHNSPEVHAGAACSPAQGAALFAVDYPHAVTQAAVDIGAAYWAEIDLIRQSAFIDMAYEMGGHGLAGFSKNECGGADEELEAGGDRMSKPPTNANRRRLKTRAGQRAYLGNRHMAGGLSMNATQAKSSMAAAVAGAIITIVLWLFTSATKIVVPEAVAESMTTLVTVYVLFAVHRDPALAKEAAAITADPAQPTS